MQKREITKQIAIRVDASISIGSGHVMRCLTLAEALRQEGRHVTFICRASAGNLASMLEQQGFAVHQLIDQEPEESTADSFRSDGSAGVAGLRELDQQADAEATVSFLRNNSWEWLIVDHYQLDETWESLVRPHVGKLFVIDDLADRQHDCDLLLDQNVVFSVSGRYAGLVSPATTQLLGPSFALLRPAFGLIRQQSSEKQRPFDTGRLFVFMGGMDAGNLTARVVDALDDPAFAAWHIDVVVGAANPHREELEKRLDGVPGATLHVQPANIVALMESAGLAIGAGGVTTLERLALGLPSIVITVAENQRLFASELHNAGYITWLGEAAAVSLSQIREAVASFVSGSDEVAERRKKSMKLVDGQGVARVARVMLHGTDPECWSVRRATPDDCRLFWYWVNDPDVRAQAFRPGSIGWEDHCAWFHAKAADPDVALLVVDGEYGAVGQVRFDLIDGSAIISYALARQFRGYGLGRALLETAIRFYEPDAALSLIADVSAGNLASSRIFRSLGFSETTSPFADGVRFVRRGSFTDRVLGSI